MAAVGTAFGITFGMATADAAPKVLNQAAAIIRRKILHVHVAAREVQENADLQPTAVQNATI
jgi:hypothetical protein